jgi:hypothetical protein
MIVSGDVLECPLKTHTCVFFNSKNNEYVLKCFLGVFYKLRGMSELRLIMGV